MQGILLCGQNMLKLMSVALVIQSWATSDPQSGCNETSLSPQNSK